MSEDQKTEKTKTDNIFENEFVKVSPEGDVILKKTKLFDERKLTTIDTESAEEQIKAFESAFKNLTSKADAFFDEWSEVASEKKEDAEKAFENLKKEVLEADAVGDFESLIDSAEKRFEKLFEEKPEEEPEEETSAEVEEVPEEKAVTEEEENDKDDTDDDGSGYYKKLAEKAESLSELTDWAQATIEFDNIDLKWSEGPDSGDSDISGLRARIDELREELDEKKQAHYEEQKKKREENLEKKNELIRKLREIVDGEKWTLTGEVGRLKGQWDKIKNVPAEEVEKLEETFSKLLTTFDEHKVDRLVKRKQQEEDNLTGKLVILEKMEAFLGNLDSKENWVELEKEFEELAKQFRKIGKVPVEKNQEVWDKYHKFQDQFHSLRFKHDKNYKKQIENFLTKKKKLIDEAEALIDADDIADAAREVNKLHRRWKKVGNLPQKDENDLWDRFKAATDAFNEKKSENIDELREQEQENLEKKEALIKQAEALKDSEEWDKTHKELQKLMDQWKEVGPVPKRKSGKVWKKFKGAMDAFYDRRRDHFKEVKEQRKDNLKEKEDVLDKLKALKDHDDPITAVEEAKPLQEEFKKAGYVPIKHKNRMWKEYREICDVIYDRFRAAKAAVEVVGRENVENFSVDDIADIRKMQSRVTKLRKEISKLSDELIQKKESLSYFKPSGKGSSLLDEVKQNIENTEKSISDKEDELADLEKEIDMIKKDV